MPFFVDGWQGTHNDVNDQTQYNHQSYWCVFFWGDVDFLDKSMMILFEIHVRRYEDVFVVDRLSILLCTCSRYCMNPSATYHALWKCALQFQSMVSTLYYEYIVYDLLIRYLSSICTICWFRSHKFQCFKLSTDELDVMEDHTNSPVSNIRMNQHVYINRHHHESVYYHETIISTFITIHFTSV